MNKLAERFLLRVREATGAGDDPSRFAASWAVGVAVGLSPFLGAQTLLALVAAALFRLNKVDVLLGTLISNPWSLAVYFPVAALLGSALTGRPLSPTALPSLLELSDPYLWRHPAEWLQPVVLSWLVGAGLLALLGGTLTYWLVYRLARRPIRAEGR